MLFFCRSNKEKGEGSVVEFSGKRIIGVLAGPAETRNVESKREMDAILRLGRFLKWFERADYGDDPCSPFQSLGAACDALEPPPNSPVGNGPTTPAAVPRRLKPGLLANRMRGHAMLVRPRLATKWPAGLRFSR